MGAAIAKEVVTNLPGVRELKDATQTVFKIGFELAKTGPGTSNTEGWWSTVDMPGSGGEDRGEQNEPGAGRLGDTQLNFRRAAVEGLIEQRRIDLSDLDSNLVENGKLIDIEDIPAGQARDEARKDLLAAIKAGGGYEAYDAFEDGYLSWKGDASGRDYPGGQNDGNGN